MASMPTKCMAAMPSPIAVPPQPIHADVLAASSRANAPRERERCVGRDGGDEAPKLATS